MKAIEVLRKLEAINKPFYTVSDFEKITRLARDTLYVALKRWVDMKVIERIGQGIYVPFGKDMDIERVAGQIYLPCYLSFEYALSKYGILNLVPYTLTFATPRKPRRYTIAGRDIEFRRIKQDLFWGFREAEGTYVAEKEKAFLDQIYFYKKGIGSFDVAEMNSGILSKRKLHEYAKRYPAYVETFLHKIKLNSGFQKGERVGSPC